MKSIPLTRGRHAGNFVIALEQHGVPVEHHLSRANLPFALMESPGSDDIIPAVSMLDFAERAAKDSGILDLGVRAGAVPISNYGVFGARVIQAPTLYGAIQTFCDEVCGECSEADYYLSHDGSRAWFCHGPVGNPVLLQHELYVLMIMTQVIQLALGDDWLPKQVQLQSSDETSLTCNELMLSTNIEFGAPITAIEVPLKSLAETLEPASGDKPITSNTESGLTTWGRLSTDPVIALQELISQSIRQSKQPTIDLAAEITGLSSRTLQRYLASKATSFSKLVDQVRFNLAISLLNDASTSITAISYELGYSNVAHFSRAFRRMTGISPRAYRDILNQ